MKFVIVACFALGFLIGWWPGGKFLNSSENRGGVKTLVKSPSRDSETIPSSVTNSIRVTRDQVEISRAKLEELLDAPVPSALSFQDFMHSAATDPPESFRQLAQWCGLDAVEKQQLYEILQQAATARQIWADQNVILTSTGPAKWTMDVPSDKGIAQADLRRQLAAVVSPEKAAAIEAGGDLPHFFGYREFAWDFQQGRVEVTARRLDSNEKTDPVGRTLELEIRAGDRHTNSLLPVSWLDSSDHTVAIPGLPVWGELLKAATEAAQK